ncbi:MAG: tRNA-uridine aminocarboxypropyltransferase [Arcobacteraceae bacterium]
MIPIARQTCYTCYRPKSSCVCEHISPINTQTQFVILMHPKEYRKTKNTTGHLTHNSLHNSFLFIGIDFTNHKGVQALLNNENNECFLLYPHKDSIKLNHQKLQSKKNIVVFIIDSTWACSRKILRENHFFKNMRTISFEYELRSKFYIKTQPNEFCLSTMESTLCVLTLLNEQKLENISTKELESFLNPFHNMVEYQLTCANQRALRGKESLHVANT